MTTHVSGNTKPSTCVSVKARAFQLTINQTDSYSAILAEFHKLKSCDYGISCLEKAPTTGHEHIHLYVHFSNAYKLSQKILKYRPHIEVCKGSPKQNIDYIKKDGNVLDEWGVEPKQGCRTVGELKEYDRDEVPATMYKTWQMLKTEQDNDIDIDDWKKDVKVYWIQGPSGCGKTEKAKEIVRALDNHKVNVLKYENNFWNGVGTAPTAIYDDFRDSHMKASEFINFIDYNVQNMNVKGGMKKNRYSTVIITSVQRLGEIYKNMSDEPKKQWERRIEVINMYPDENNLVELYE